MADDGVVMLTICGTYQMLGHEFVTLEGARIAGVGVLDVVTRGQAERLIGNNFVDTPRGRSAGRLREPQRDDRAGPRCPPARHDRSPAAATTARTAPRGRSATT